MYIELIRQKESIKTRQIVMEDPLYPMKQLKRQQEYTKRKLPENIRRAHIKLNQQLIMKTFFCIVQTSATGFFLPGPRALNKSQH